MGTEHFQHILRIILRHSQQAPGAARTSDGKPLYRTTLANGIDVDYVEKGTKNPLGLTRELYEKAGYKPAFEDLPKK